ncbi:MAG: 5'-deoxynucleotidase, partial [Atopobium sp.]|nr:5'-deoxynucleotidase [Atopobium sp.]
EIRDAYHQVEARAEKTILSTLPEDLQDAYAQVLTHSAEASESEAYLRKLIKAADKIAALIKCIEEAQSGNSEFITAEASTRGVVEDLADSLPEVRDFMTEFLPSYGETLDQLL